MPIPTSTMQDWTDIVKERIASSDASIHGVSLGLTHSRSYRTNSGEVGNDAFAQGTSFVKNSAVTTLLVRKSVNLVSPVEFCRIINGRRDMHWPDSHLLTRSSKVRLIHCVCKKALRGNGLTIVYKSRKYYSLSVSVWVSAMSILGRLLLVEASGTWIEPAYEVNIIGQNGEELWSPSKLTNVESRLRFLFFLDLWVTISMVYKSGSVERK